MTDDLDKLSSRMATARRSLSEMTMPRRTARMTGSAALRRAPAAGLERAPGRGHLRSLELFGMRFGLDRMRRMMTVLGSPAASASRRSTSLGTNGKSSTTRMTAAILERHGLRTGAYTSPHLVSYSERVQIGERDIDDAGASPPAIARAAWAAERVNRTLAEDDHVTQFELLTAAALWAMAERERRGGGRSRPASAAATTPPA